MESPREWNGPAKYQFTIMGILGKQLSDLFEETAIELQQKTTTITAALPDPFALRELLFKMKDLGVPLISIKRME